jgi:nucleotide-binding universal stress UspA family protein
MGGAVHDVAELAPVLFAYDGSDLAEHAIEQAARELASGRRALVLCVWQPGDVGFVPVGGQHFDALDAAEVKDAAEKTATHGASIAEEAGFRPESLTVEAAPTWKGIVEVATQREAGLIVLGSHRRGGVIGHLLGSVTSAVLAHSAIPVLVIRQHS